jgi:hypothetical protein
MDERSCWCRWEHSQHDEWGDGCRVKTLAAAPRPIQNLPVHRDTRSPPADHPGHGGFAIEVAQSRSIRRRWYRAGLEPRASSKSSESVENETPVRSAHFLCTRRPELAGTPKAHCRSAMRAHPCGLFKMRRVELSPVSPCATRFRVGEMAAPAAPQPRRTGTGC